MGWKDFLRNPTNKLGGGKPPKGVSRAKRRDLLGTSWSKGLGPMENGVLGAAVYNDSVIAGREMKEDKTKEMFVNGLKEVGYEGDFKLEIVLNTIIAMKKGKSAKKLTVFGGNGSPYRKPELIQTKKSDEAPDMFDTDLITGARLREEGARRRGAGKLTRVVLTLPHAHDDGINDGHDTDWKCVEAAMRVAGHLHDNGIDADIIKGDKDRDFIDLNREESQLTDFHKSLDKLLDKNPLLLLDIHSYPADYPVWGGYDVVLFANGPVHDDKDNEDALDLAKHIRGNAPGAKVLIDTADWRKHFIHNKGLMRGIESHLIEFNEGTDTVAAEKAVASYAAGVKNNPPTELPPGVKWQQVSMRIAYGADEDGYERRASLLPMLELELEERGFTKTKQDIDDFGMQKSITFAIPLSIGKPGPTIQAQRNVRSVILRGAQELNNDDIILLKTLLEESSMLQPRLNPIDDVEEFLKGKGITGNELKMIGGWVKKGDGKSKSLVFQKKKELNLNLSNKDIEELFSGSSGGANLSKDASNEDIIKALEAMGRKIPRNKEGKLDRDKAIKEANKGGKKVEQKGLESFKEAKKKGMNLSTPVTKLVLSNLIPGTGRRIKEAKKEQQKKNQNKQVDVAKVKKLKEFKKLSQQEKDKMFPQGKGTNWNEIKKKFGNKDIFKNPPNIAIGQKLIHLKSQHTFEYRGSTIRIVTKRGGDFPMTLHRLFRPRQVVMKDKEGEPEFKMVSEKAVVVTDDTLSKTFKLAGPEWEANPPVQPIPQEGRFSMDITNQMVKGAKVKVVNRGKESKLTVDKLEEPPSGELDKSYGKIVRINMFRKRAGFKVVGAFSQPEYIISVETGGKHFYAKSEVEVDGYALLKHFPDKKSEPRLRVETRGYLELYGDERTVVIRGKEHPLYDKIIVHHEGRMLNNPGTKSTYAQEYIDDHKLMNPKDEKKKFKRLKLKGAVGSKEFFEQVSKKMQNFGEGQGWVRDGYLYWQEGPGHENFVNVAGNMLEGATAWMHTHPGAWEPSQTSPDDFKVMHGLFINHGIQDCFTIIADRVDWFHFMKKDRLSVDDMVENIEDFENDIMEEFNIAEEAFQDKMGDKPFLTLEQTRYITEHFNKVIPEFYAKYRAYTFSPQQINERIKRNPPARMPLVGLY